MSNKPFLSHIGGLRGIAILLVILFHLNSSCFPHGFYGVDIFLVISGYLLFLSFSRQNYQLNIREFATKKLLRIFPPMIILVLLTMVAAFYLLEGDNLIETSRTGRYTLFCYANDFLRRTQEDYFAPNALENPFLHMWYLSVTIHLYLMFAIGCIIYRYLPKKTSMLLIWLIGTASFCYGYSYQLRDIFQELNLPVWDQYAAVSHYRTLPRVWELLAGGAILLLPYTASKAKSSLLTLTGLAATLIPAFSSNFLASYGAPAVVLGTMLIVRYMPTSILMPVLSNKILLWVGGFSFSLYLVHMPIIALYLISQHSISGWVDYSIIVMLSLALGWLFWFLVEKRHMNVYAVLTLWGVTMSLCVLGKKLDDIKNSMYPEIQAIQNAPYDDWKFCEPGTLPHALDKKNLLYNDGIFNMADSTIKRPKTDNPLMQMGPASPTPSLLLLGDSHGQCAYYGLNRLCHDMNHPGVFLSTTTLPFWDFELYYTDTYYFDQAKAEALMKWIEANPCITHVVIAQFWRMRLKPHRFTHWGGKSERLTNELMYQSLREFIKRIHDMGRHVILLGPTPEPAYGKAVRYVRSAIRKGQTPIDMSPISCSHEKIAALNKDVFPLFEKLKAEGLCSVLDVLAVIPKGQPFLSYENGKFLMYDNDHLSGDGSTEIFRRLRPQLESLLQRPLPTK